MTTWPDTTTKALSGLAELQRRDRRSRERATRTIIRADLVLARCKGRGVPVALARRQHDANLAAAGVVLSVDEGLVVGWRAHARAVAKALDVEVHFEAAIANLNGYAMTRARILEVSPITSAATYATFLHEAGHAAAPCEPSHRRVPIADGSSACIQCELSAWRFAITSARPAWTQAMHDQLAASLATYRPHATVAERRELDCLASQLGYRAATLAATVKRF